MNLASSISLPPERTKAEALLRSALEEHLVFTINKSHISYLYPLTDAYAIYVTAVNERELNDEVHYKVYIDMLFDNTHALNLSVLAKSTGVYRNPLRKHSYPTRILGDKAYRFLTNEDILDSDFAFFRLASFAKLMEYLCILFTERPELFSGDRQGTTTNSEE